MSQTVIKAFNYHAIVCLHADAGQFRPCEVEIGDHEPPRWFHVQAHMDDFVNQINRAWDSTDPVVLASYALWRVNWIHPFVNGNGRTARLVSYYLLCLKAGGMLAGTVPLPELLRRDRHKPDDPYVAALKAADASVKAGALDLSEIHKLVSELLDEQIASAPSDDAANTPSTGD